MGSTRRRATASRVRPRCRPRLPCARPTAPLHLHRRVCRAARRHRQARCGDPPWHEAFHRKTLATCRRRIKNSRESSTRCTRRPPPRAPSASTSAQFPRQAAHSAPWGKTRTTGCKRRTCQRATTRRTPRAEPRPEALGRRLDWPGCNEWQMR